MQRLFDHGKLKSTGADRCRFFDITRGSALESAAALDVLVPRPLACIGVHSR